MRALSILFTALALVATHLPTAHAESDYDLSTLKSGEVLLSISATERQEVTQDTLIATLEYTVQGNNKKLLQDKVNKAMQKALSLVDKEEELQVATRHYQVYRVDQPRDEAGKLLDDEHTTWRAQQGLQLTSTDATTVLDHVAKLQSEGLHMTGLNYTLSSNAQEAATDALLAAALQKLQARANKAAAALGKASAELVEVTVQGGHHAQPHRRMMAMEMASAADSVTTPSARPDQAEVTLTVAARAILGQ